MTIPTLDLQIIRDRVGDLPDDATVEVVYDYTGADPLRAALAVLKRRKANIDAAPASMTVAGDYSENWTANLKSLADEIRALEGEISAADLGVDPALWTAGLPVLSTSAIVRCDRDRLFTSAPAPTIRPARTYVSTSTSVPRGFGWVVFESDVACSVGDGKAGAPAPAWAVGLNITDLQVSVATPGTGSTMEIQLRRVRAGTPVDVLTTPVSVAAGEYTAANETVDLDNDDIEAGDMFYLDRDAVHDTPAFGLSAICTAS